MVIWDCLVKIIVSGLPTKLGDTFIQLKGRWKRETMGAGKEANDRKWSRTVAIEVYFQFEHAVF